MLKDAGGGPKRKGVDSPNEVRQVPRNRLQLGFAPRLVQEVLAGDLLIHGGINETHLLRDINGLRERLGREDFKEKGKKGTGNKVRNSVNSGVGSE